MYESRINGAAGAGTAPPPMVGLGLIGGTGLCGSCGVVDADDEEDEEAGGGEYWTPPLTPPLALRPKVRSLCRAPLSPA